MKRRNINWSDVRGPAAAGISLWTALHVGLGWAFGETVEQLASSVMSDPTVAFFAAVGAVSFVVATLFTGRVETDPTA